jgi:hypothetical protein
MNARWRAALALGLLLSAGAQPAAADDLIGPAARDINRLLDSQQGGGSAPAPARSLLDEAQGSFAAEQGPAPPKVVPLVELTLAPRKYAGQAIEVRDLICYDADVSDYRCLALRIGVPAVIFLEKITGAVAQIEQNCDQLDMATHSPKCRVALRFTFEIDDLTEDLISGYQRRLIFRPATAEAIVGAPVRRH